MIQISKHAHERLQERYGFTLNDRDVAKLSNLIYNGNAEFLMNRKNRYRDIYVINITFYRDGEKNTIMKKRDPYKIVAVYEANHDKIITFLPRESYHEFYDYSNFPYE